MPFFFFVVGTVVCGVGGGGKNYNIAQQGDTIARGKEETEVGAK